MAQKVAFFAPSVNAIARFHLQEQENATSFFSFSFHTYVPSLSWQQDRF
jgi:hypothetical protein